MNSTHKVEIVPIELTKHPNADTLSVCKVFGYTVVLRTTDWEGIRLGAYICPDSIVDVKRPEFSFLAEYARADGTYRVKAKKLRGIVSFGLLIPAPDDVAAGDDVAKQLGVAHYEPPPPGEAGKAGLIFGGEATSGPDVPHFKYDLEAFRRYHHFLTEDELVHVTEKMDGTSARYVYYDGVMYCGSRTMWKLEYPSYNHVTFEYLRNKGVEEEKVREIHDKLHSKPKQRNLWWETLTRHPNLEKMCRDNPGVVIYGEIAGTTNCIKYGFAEGNRFFGFDILAEGCWLATGRVADSFAYHQVEAVPEIGTMNYSFDRVCEAAEGFSLAKGAKPGTIREGCVVKPLVERQDPRVGRVAFKAVSGAFLEKFR